MSNATCLIWIHVFDVLLFVVSRVIMICRKYSQLLKKPCVRQGVLDKRFPLGSGVGHLSWEFTATVPWSTPHDSWLGTLGRCPNQKCTSKGMRRQGVVLKHRMSSQKSLCPVVLCPYLCSSGIRNPLPNKTYNLHRRCTIETNP